MPAVPCLQRRHMSLLSALSNKDFMDENALFRAQALLERAPLWDGHNDLPWVIKHKAHGDVTAYDLTRIHEDGDTDIPRLRAGQVSAQWFSAFQPTNAPHPARTTLEMINIIRQLETVHADVFFPARCAADFAKAQAEQKIASYIVVEGGVGLENSLAPLSIWYAAGVRMLIPCHNETLDWVDSATDAPRHQGFSAFGLEVIAECNRLGIIVDGAHLSHTALRRLLDVSVAPICISHANAFALCDHPRNVPDDVLRRLPDNGGLIMATFVPSFVSQSLRDWLRPFRDPYGKVPLDQDHAEAEKDAPFATRSQVVDHILYLIATAGIDHVGIGSDFFGGPQPRGLEHVGCFPYLIADLLERGLAEEDVEKLTYRNILRVMQCVENIAQKRV